MRFSSKEYDIKERSNLSRDGNINMYRKNLQHFKVIETINHTCKEAKEVQAEAAWRPDRCNYQLDAPKILVIFIL